MGKVTAAGGRGGDAAGSAATYGGTAEADLYADVIGGPGIAHLSAVGGAGGTGYAGLVGVAGTAMITAQVQSDTSALIQCESKGSTAGTYVVAMTPAGPNYMVSSSASAPGGSGSNFFYGIGYVDGDASAEAASTASRPRMAADGSPAQAFTSSETSPAMADLLAATAGAPHARAAFTGGGVTPLALTSVSDAGLTTVVGGLGTVANGVAVSSQVGGELTVGLFHGAYTGDGHADLSIQVNGTVVKTVTFGNYADLAAYFNDAVFDVGKFVPDGTSGTAVYMSLTLEPFETTSAFSGELILGTVPSPEPSSAALVTATVLVGLCGRRGRGKLRP